MAAPELRDYDIGAQILSDLGVRDMIPLSNHPCHVVGLEGYGLIINRSKTIRAIGAGQGKGRPAKA